MSSSQDRRQLESKQKAQADNAKKAAELRTKESRKRSDAAKAEKSAAGTTSSSTAAGKKREAARALEAASKYGKDASALETKAAGYGAEAAKLQAKIVKADAAENEKSARQRAIEQRAAEKLQAQLSKQLSSTTRRVAISEARTDEALRVLNAPKAEKLRVLMLGASSEGDLRVTREHTRIRRAVEVAAHRDQIEFDVRLSATASDLQEGIAKFRPHVVHFSGHGDEQLVTFEDDVDELHTGVVVTASAFASACRATDTPPTLVVFNACHSVGTAKAIVERFAPLAIGMAGSIADVDALNFATSLYSSIANGQSVNSAHMAGKASIELGGGEHELPHLVEASGVEANAVFLVQTPQSHTT